MTSTERGYGVLEAYNKTHLQYVHRRSNDSSIIDELWLMKEVRLNEWDFLLNPSVIVILCVLGIAFILFMVNMVILCRKIKANKKEKEIERKRREKYSMIDKTLSHINTPHL